MRRIVLVLLVAALAAVGLWVLSELEGSPASAPAPSPTPARGMLVPENGSLRFNDPNLFVSALLPGEDWTPDASPTGDPSLYHSDAHSLLFAVSRTEEMASKSVEELSGDATRFAQANLSGYTVDQNSLQNVDASRVEGIGKTGVRAGYHIIGYFYSTHENEYLLWVGAKTTAWDAAHRSLINQILDSVLLW